MEKYKILWANEDSHSLSTPGNMAALKVYLVHKPKPLEMITIT